MRAGRDGDEFGGDIPLGPFARIGGEEIGQGIVETLRDSRSPAVLMRSHSVFTIGPDARRAVKAAVLCEDAARTVLLVRGRGEPGQQREAGEQGWDGRPLWGSAIPHDPAAVLQLKRRFQPPLDIEEYQRTSVWWLSLRREIPRKRCRTESMLGSGRGHVLHVTRFHFRATSWDVGVLLILLVYIGCITVTFRSAVDALGKDVVFQMYAAFAAVGIVFVRLVSETKNRSLEEIETYWTQGARVTWPGSALTSIQAAAAQRAGRSALIGI